MGRAVIAVDLGATSGRVIVADFDDGRVDLSEVHRFSTGATSRADGLRVDIAEIYAQIQAGITAAVTSYPGEIVAVGIDCWAVDYGLLDQDGLLEDPFNYRDPRTQAGKAAVSSVIHPDELYARTGIQDNAINTINQLMEDHLTGRLARATQFLLLPDLLGYWLTGNSVAERTNASTTGLLTPDTRQWDIDLIARLGLPQSIFPPLVDAGSVIGTIVDGAARGIPLIAVGSHDTASAVVGAPLHEPTDAYLSSGTWSLIGVELEAPILSDASRTANLTNEQGVDGTVRYLKNVMGMWLLSQCQQQWAEVGITIAVQDLLAQASMIADVPRFDATDPALLAPGNMATRIAALIGDEDRWDDAAYLTRTILESLADAYAHALQELTNATGRRPTRLVIVGGGSHNWLLNTLTANRAHIDVTAGPAEATAIGNALIQARAVGLVSGTLRDLRKIIMDSTDITVHHPDPLAHITALSNEFGANAAFVRAGGGNSSAKVDGQLWIKPSGVPLATLQADDLVALDLTVLLDSLDAPDPDPQLGDPVNQIAERARRVPGPRRPSVEILFHALIPDTYVLHTHPILINAVTCNANGRELTHSLFGDEVLWVEYVDPGLPLARTIQQRRDEFTARTGTPAPKATFLMNHGLIVASDDPAEVRRISYDILDTITAALNPAQGAHPVLTQIAEEFREAVQASAVAIGEGERAIRYPATPAGKAYLNAGPLIPDQIVYAGSFPVVLDGGDVSAAVQGFREAHGTAPIIAVAPGLGVIAAGESERSAHTALDVFLDALTVAEAADRLGTVRALDSRERAFIENWEAEAYRRQVAKA